MTAKRGRPEVGGAAVAGAPVGVWLISGASLADVYPCRCHEPDWRPGFYCGRRCPCWGRVDDGLIFAPANCCGRRFIPGVSIAT